MHGLGHHPDQPGVSAVGALFHHRIEVILAAQGLDFIHAAEQLDHTLTPVAVALLGHQVGKECLVSPVKGAEPQVHHSGF